MSKLDKSSPATDSVREDQDFQRQADRARQKFVDEVLTQAMDDSLVATDRGNSPTDVTNVTAATATRDASKEASRVGAPSNSERDSAVSKPVVDLAAFGITRDLRASSIDSNIIGPRLLMESSPPSLDSFPRLPQAIVLGERFDPLFGSDFAPKIPSSDPSRLLLEPFASTNILADRPVQGPSVLEDFAKSIPLGETAQRVDAITGGNFAFEPGAFAREASLPFDVKPDVQMIGTTKVESINGQVVRISNGEDSSIIDRDPSGRIIRITEDFDGSVSVLEAGKDFRLGDAVADKSGAVRILSSDGKFSVTLGSDFSSTTRVIGDNSDGSKDKIVAVRTRDGVYREFQYDPAGENVVAIVDRLKTNNGQDLVAVTKKIGSSNVWEFSSNYGRPGLRTNVEVDKASGDYKSDEVKLSRPRDLIAVDGSDNQHRDLASARQRFAEFAGKNGVFGGAEKCEAWQKKFEERCRQLAHEGRKAPTDKQIIQTYDNLEAILKGSGHGVSAGHRRWLVESALREYADPKKYINQGSHPSCALAMVERHVVQTHPDDHARVLKEAVNDGYVVSKDKINGKYKRLNLAPHMLKPDNEVATAAKGGGWSAAWSYSNKLFQLTAISVAYPGYRGNGHGFPGASIHQARRANNFATAEKTLPLVDSWGGNRGSFSSLQSALKKGTVGYFVPGHAMSIDKAKVVNGVGYVHVDNWWGGSGDGWRRWDRV